MTLPIRNVHRTVGAMLSGEVARRYGSLDCKKTPFGCIFQGSAGQSFGAFLAKESPWSWRRRERLRREGPFGREDHRLPSATFAVLAGRKHPRW
jgi:hypothetical protein